MYRSIIFIIFIFTNQACLAQAGDKSKSSQDQYFAEQKKIAGAVSHYIYSDFPAFNSMNESQFTREVDSLRNIFVRHLENYSDNLDQSKVEDEQVGIKYFFDRLLLDYPYHHQTYTGNSVSLSEENQARLESNLTDLNNPELLSNRDFREYVKAFLYHQTNEELKKGFYAKIDNQRLHAVWKLISHWFKKQEIRDFWRHKYLYDHIENIGIKNIDELYSDFIATCENPDYVKRIRKLYEDQEKGRQGHLITTYKVVDGFQLDMHMFLPDTTAFSGIRPAMVYFHGGSWSEGKPDWFFDAGKYYANNGWVAAAVEYRIGARHGTLPFEAVKDARSAIRWLRENAKTYQINPSKIVATGNSAGGHLVLATALADEWNEETDNLNISPTPNVLMVNAGVYDLTVDNCKWIVKNLANKDLVKQISPNHLLKKNLPPMLIIHGKNDRNCLYSTAEYFVNEMRASSNDIEFHTIKGAGHFIWFGKYANQVSKIRREYLERLEFE